MIGTCMEDNNKEDADRQPDKQTDRQTDELFHSTYKNKHTHNFAYTLQTSDIVQVKSHTTSPSFDVSLCLAPSTDR